MRRQSIFVVIKIALLVGTAAAGGLVDNPIQGSALTYLDGSWKAAAYALPLSRQAGAPAEPFDADEQMSQEMMI